MAKHRIAVGDRFCRPTTPRHVFVVAALVDHPGRPPHARLRAEGGPDELLVGTYALTDPEVWRRVD